MQERDQVKMTCTPKRQNPQKTKKGSDKRVKEAQENGNPHEKRQRIDLAKEELKQRICNTQKTKNRLPKRHYHQKQDPNSHQVKQKA